MIDYTTFQLDNGLRVAHSYDPETAMCAVNVLYDTGARDEQCTLTGIAHLFEHLMFSATYDGRSFDTILEEAGGHSNAFTGNDFTDFFQTLPAQNAETAFFLESDRMLSLSLTEKALRVQQHVVIEEFKQVCLNSPYGDLMHYLRPMLYGPAHPYRWPVIGIEPSHIERVKLEDANNWFFSHYAPNNALLTVVGNITLERTKELAKKWFGRIPAREVAVRDIVDDPWPTEQKRQDVCGNVPSTMLAIGYRMDPHGTRGFFAADAITDILAAGMSSRFKQRLVLGTNLFAAAEASISGAEHSGMLLLFAHLTSDAPEDVDRAIELMIGEAKQLAEPGNVTEYELERRKNKYESAFTFENIPLESRAQNLAMAVYHGDDINKDVERYRSITLDDISATAKRVFIDHAPAVLVYKSKAPQPPKGGFTSALELPL